MRKRTKIRLAIALVILILTIVGGWIARRKAERYAAGKLLLEMVKINDVEGVAWAIEAGADVNGESRGGFGYFVFATPLHAAAWNCNAECLKLLLEAGANADGPFSGSAIFTTPLHLAARSGKAECVRLLLAAGADVNAVNEADFTALHGAAYMGVNEVLDYLLDHGADIDAQDFRGRTAYRLAEGAKQSYHYQAWSEVADLLAELGADTSLGIPGTIHERLRNLVAAE